ncbi:response regulator [bacterium]|nr:response regulator [bacterium]MBU1614913.1 response regulator [bacterium]
MAKKILVVDDNVDMVDLLKSILEMEGYDVIEAFDGQEALDKSKQQQPDFILLDIMMPIMDGWETCRRLKGCRKTSQIPVTILTARVNPEDREKASRLGADDYLTKPFDPDELLNRIKKVVVKKDSNGKSLLSVMFL